MMGNGKDKGIRTITVFGSTLFGEVVLIIGKNNKLFLFYIFGGEG